MIVNGVGIFLHVKINGNMRTAFDIWVHLGSISDEHDDHWEKRCQPCHTATNETLRAGFVVVAFWFSTTGCATRNTISHSAVRSTTFMIGIALVICASTRHNRVWWVLIMISLQKMKKFYDSYVTWSFVPSWVFGSIFLTIL